MTAEFLELNCNVANKIFTQLVISITLLLRTHTLVLFNLHIKKHPQLLQNYTNKQKYNNQIGTLILHS